VYVSYLKTHTPTQSLKVIPALERIYLLTKQESSQVYTASLQNSPNDSSGKEEKMIVENTHTHNRFTALWNLSGKTRVSRYQKNIHPLLSS